jgi:hypothetical protein
MALTNLALMILDKILISATKPIEEVIMLMSFLIPKPAYLHGGGNKKGLSNSCLIALLLIFLSNIPYANSAITVSPPTGRSSNFTKIFASKGKKISILEPNLIKPNSFPCSTFVPASTYQQILRAKAPAI